MRYLNWDVLLFPEESRIPVQEFDTKCHALPVPADCLPAARIVNLAGNNHQSSVTQLPTLTGFISSLEAGRAFRVSIHSWEKPRASDLLLSFKPAPERLVFEVRLYIDGQLKAQRYLNEQNSWPEVIDTTYDSSKDYTKQLRFPPFHQQILQQSHWDASDGLGRIRIVLAEGISRTSELCTGPRGFDKLRDVVAFSFQHAPRNILEYSAIAWPNARMFQRPTMPAAPKSDFDSHAHSPQRSSESMTQLTTQFMRAKANTPSATSLTCSKWAQGPAKPGVADDPFTGPANAFGVRERRKTNTDASMADYASRKTHSDMSGVDTQQPYFHQQVDRAAIEEILKALTPSKRAALASALSPPKQEVTMVNSSTMKSLSNSRVESVRSVVPAFRPQPAGPPATRRSSNDSRRSVSGQSATMSWEETPTLEGIWSNNNEYPGLLPSIQSKEDRHRSTSVGSKRKRSMSPPRLDPGASDTLANMKGMSTSPCKGSPSPNQHHNAGGPIVTIESDNKE